MKYFLAKHYEISETKKVPIIKNWLGRDGPQFACTLSENKHK